MIYKVHVIETIPRSFTGEVEAESREEAEKKALAYQFISVDPPQMLVPSLTYVDVLYQIHVREKQ